VQARGKASPAHREHNTVRKNKRKMMTAAHQPRKQVMRPRLTERKRTVRRKKGRPRQRRPGETEPVLVSSSLKCSAAVRTERKLMAMEASCRMPR
jgi:hypothetical protein